MTSPELSPSQRRKVRQLATMAYEREMSHELDRIEREFHRWRAGKVSVPELIDTLRTFHEGPNKKLSVLYYEGDPLPAVARAIALGFLENHEVGTELIESLRKQIEFFKS